MCILLASLLAVEQPSCVGARIDSTQGQAIYQEDRSRWNFSDFGRILLLSTPSGYIHLWSEITLKPQTVPCITSQTSAGQGTLLQKHAKQ